MKKLLLTVLAIALFCMPVVYSQETLTILELNDTHSNLSALGPRDPGTLEGTHGGIARAATYINSVRQAETNTMLLHAGDSFIGDMYFNYSAGIYEFSLLKSLGLDAFTLGNHEFDLGTSILADSYAEGLAPVPILSANFILNDTTLQQFGDMVLPYIIKEYGSFKVGVFGLTTPETNLLSNISPEAQIDENFIQIAGNTVAELDSQNCNLIILLSHLGLLYDTALAENIPGINLIVGGHNHYKTEDPVEINNPGGTITYIVQAGAFYQDVGRIDFEFNQGVATMTNYQLVPMDSTIQEDPTFLQAVNDMIGEIENVYGPIYSQQIATATGYFEEIADSLNCPGWHDTPVGNLITDAYRITMGTDIALQAGGSIAQPIYAGPLVGIDLFRTVGYGFNEHNGLGFPMMTFDLTGAEICEGLEKCLENIEYDDEFLPQVSGMTYQYDPFNVPGNRLDTVLINGSMIDPEATYTIAANWQLYKMLSSFNLTPENPVEYPDSTEFQVLSAYVMQLGTISPVKEGRIQADVLDELDEQGKLIPGQFQLFQNYPNPFNPETEIRYSIPESGVVQLKIYDSLGQEVKTLVNEYKQSGSYVIEWNAKNMSSGVYFYTLESGDNRITKKMLLLR